MNKWSKNIKTWKIGKTLYISVVFTWQLKEAFKIADEYNGKVEMGGPALMVPTKCDVVEPILFHNPLATFTTRGCPNKCGFCAVPKLEKEFIELNDFRPAPMICDNNFLASSIKHIEMVIDKIKRFSFVDFQGIDANYLTPEKADLLGKTKCVVHIGFDKRNESKVYDSVMLLKKRSTPDIVAYVIVGYNDTFDEAKHKLELVRSWGIKPFPMRYQPLDTEIKNSYLDPTWTETQMKNIVRYYSKLNWLGHIPFDEYKDIPDQGKLF